MAEDEPSVTGEELAAWLTPRQALNIVNEAFGDIGVTSRTIMGRLIGGMIRAAGPSSWGDAETLKPPEIIPAYFWPHLSTGGKADWWDSGDVRFFFGRDKHRSVSRTGRYFSIRFDPDGVRAIVANLPKRPAQHSAPAAAPAQSPPLEKETNKGGRPKKEWWDDLWIEMFRRIYFGEFKPKNQADLERAMLDWASEHDYALSESSVKAPARKLFAALRDEGKN